jgi:hypothetical protein
LSLSERKKALERRGLCMYCLKHAAELECYGQGGPMKPRCPRPECEGGHTIGAHELLGEADASINLIPREDCDSDDDEEWWVNTVRVEEGGESLEELEDLGVGENERGADTYCISACMRKDDSGLEDELGYFWDAPVQIQTNGRRTGGGLQDPKNQAPRRRTRRKSDTSSAYSGVSPKKVAMRKKQPHPRMELWRAPAVSAIKPQRGSR